MREENIFTGKYSVPFLATLACILWGTAFPFLKISYQELGIGKNDYLLKILFASYRFLMAAVILLIWRVIKTRKSISHDITTLGKKSIIKLLLLGFIQTTLQYFFFYNGLANTTGVKASILNTLGIFLTVVLSHFIFYYDKLNLQKSLGLVLGFSGVVLVNLSRGEFSFSFNFLGEGFIIMAAITSALSNLLVKKISLKIEPTIITAYQMLMGALILFLIAVTGVSPLSLNMSLKALLILIYLSFVSAAGFGLWYSLIKYNKLGYISIYRFVIPVSGVFFSTLLLNEGITGYIFTALVFVSTGIVLINYKRT
ncbi:DMT family transporter [Halothermothrix orenii]|uniref:Integral membrane protein DUF6 n=1 Tax=Halothermothrix orenii (strain H 168 / OCM 544 / DSM 9562) TaxID=373903 RepID=B8CXM5_HALOH|nr:DMT family transporter [Halothermothrix orenii]ACL70044.1 Integral membrane protein DUF6 [Halothermothrix orenii H 168]